MEARVGKLRQSFNSNVTKSLEWRLKQLSSIERLIDENKDELCEALKYDLNKSTYETTVMELGLIKNGIVHMQKNLASWMQPQRTYPLVQLRPLYTTFISYQPLGVVLIIGAWNYPYQLTFAPLLAALGNHSHPSTNPSTTHSLSCTHRLLLYRLTQSNKHT